MHFTIILHIRKKMAKDIYTTGDKPALWMVISLTGFPFIH